MSDIDNQVIKENAIYLIDENLVREGVDEDGSNSFPWITRRSSAGVTIVEKITDESKSKISELQDELKDKTNTQDKVLGFIMYCFKFKEISIDVLNIAKDFVL